MYAYVPVRFHVVFAASFWIDLRDFRFSVVGYLVPGKFSRLPTERRVRASVGKLNLKVAAGHRFGRKQLCVVSLCRGVSILRK